MNIDEVEFNQFCDFLCEVCGIWLTPSKRYLITVRIERILIDNQIASISELMRKIVGNAILKDQVIDAMTTNETYWFRDSYPFKHLQSKAIPELNVNVETDSEVRVWCAACSSGQEAYSIAIAAAELQSPSFFTPNTPVNILATDVSTSMLNVAKLGVYDDRADMRGLNQEQKLKYFQSIGDDNTVGNQWQVKSSIKDRVKFRTFNMLGSFAILGSFDVIFCRNVLIYFSSALKQDVLKRLHTSLKPGGYLYLGSSESLGECADLFDMVQCNQGIVYRARSFH